MIFLGREDATHFIARSHAPPPQDPTRDPMTHFAEGKKRGLLRSAGDTEFHDQLTTVQRFF